MRTQLVLIFWKKNGERSEKIWNPLASRARNDTCLKWINHFCMRCSVFENESSGLESRQFGGVLWVVLLRVQNKWILKETDGMNELDEELWCSFRNKQSKRRQTKFKARLRLFNTNDIWSRLLWLFLPSLIALAKKESSSFPRVVLTAFSAISVNNNRRLQLCHVHCCNKVRFN